MEKAAVVCPQCGYDFPVSEPAPEKLGALKTVLSVVLILLVCVLLYLAYHFRTEIGGLFK